MDRIVRVNGMVYKERGVSLDEFELVKEAVRLLIKKTKKPNKPNYWRYRIPR